MASSLRPTQARIALRRALKASPAAETRYVSDLRRILAGVHAWTVEALEPTLAAWDPPPPERRGDAGKPSIAHVTNILLSGLKSHTAIQVGAAFDRMAKVVSKKNVDGLKLVGIRPSAIGAEDVLKRARDANIRLVEDAGRTYAAQVRELFDDPDNFGRTAKEMKELLLERGGVSESRAQLIARDQTLKLNSALTKDRHERAGIKRYRWSGSLDERERPRHRALEGQVFDWDAPPVTNDDGEENHPGEDYQCRCCAVPVLDEDEAVEAEQAVPEAGAAD
jgi:SPP1 gp7 family putative phage head morphogenesis protein